MPPAQFPHNLLEVPSILLKTYIFSTETKRTASRIQQADQVTSLILKEERRCSVPDRTLYSTQTRRMSIVFNDRACLRGRLQVRDRRGHSFQLFATRGLLLSDIWHRCVAGEGFSIFPQIPMQLLHQYWHVSGQHSGLSLLSRRNLPNTVPSAYRTNLNVLAPIDLLREPSVERKDQRD